MARLQAAQRISPLSRTRWTSRRKQIQQQCRSLLSSLSSFETTKFKADPLLVDDNKAPTSWHKTAALVYRDVVTEEQANLISDEILGTRMRRKRYEKGHWDSVITGYREMELYDIHELVEAMESGSNPTIESTDTVVGISNAFYTIRRHLNQNHGTSADTKWLPCHAIDLKQDGQLSAHVDSIRFSGHMVAGLSLLSPAIMRLKEDKQQNEENSSASNSSAHIDLYLPPRSLYVLTGVGRYEYSHELLPDGSIFSVNDEEPIVVTRDQRLSIIFRDAKEGE